MLDSGESSARKEKEQQSKMVEEEGRQQWRVQHQAGAVPEDVLVLGQDRSINVIVESMTAAVCALLFLWCSWSSWVAYLLLATALINANFAYMFRRTAAKRFRYIDENQPWNAFFTLALLGALQFVNWRVCTHLVYHRLMNIWWLDALMYGSLAAYTLYVLLRRRSRRLRTAIIGAFVVISMLAVAFAAFYKHNTRLYQHIHIRNDWRLLYLGCSELVLSALLAFGTRVAPAWILESVALIVYIVMGVTAHHKRLLMP